MAKASKKKKSASKATFKKVDKNSDIPASHGELMEVRSELKSDIASLSISVKSEFVSVRSEIRSLTSTVDSKFNMLVAEIKSMRLSLEANNEKLLSEVHAVKAIVEEQNARNKFVFDGYKALSDGQETLKEKVRKLEKATFGASDI